MVEDFQNTDYGVIAKDWKFIPLGNVCIKIQDGNYGELYPKSNEFVSIGVPFLTSKAIGKDGVLKENLIDCITKEKHSLLVKAHLALHDVLFTNRGASVGAIGFVDERISNGNIGPQLTLLRANQDCLEPLYLFQVMKSAFVQKQIVGKDAGSAMNFFGIGSTKKFQIPIPHTKTEQTSIATALNDADALITQLEKLIAKKRNIKQGAMQELLKPKEGWEVKRIEEMFDVTAGGDYKKEFSSKIRDEKHKYPIYSNSLVDEGLYGYCSYYTSDSNCITVTARGTIGHANYRDHKFTAIGRVIVLCPKEEIDCFYIHEYINNKINFVLEVTGVPQLTAPQISKYSISLPKTKADQTHIAQILSDMDTEIEAFEKKLDKYKMIKQGMMQDLLTGKIRLV